MFKGKDDFIEVPPPLYKYSGDDNIHDDNKKVVEAHQQDRAIILPDKQVKRLTDRLKEINRKLRKANASQRLADYENLEQDYNSSRLKLEKQAEPELITHVQNLEQQLTAERESLVPVRKLVHTRNRIRQKLKAHKTAVAEDKKERELLRLMKQEAEIISEQMSRTLARIGFSHSESVGNSTKTYYVNFDHVVTTPDQHQFKIAASRRGFAGGTVELLPEGVRVTEILRPEIMRELSVTLEREVWSPHVEEDVNNTNGAWIVVERLGLYEGIPKNVTYRQLMARYETADHSRIPLPAGLKKGRRINWTYLDSHASTHMMFTGITGSGKTNTVQACLTSIIEKQSPADVLLAIIDLKNQGDFKEIAQAPHNISMNEAGIIHDIDEVVTVLRHIRAEMHWRQKRIGSVAKNISSYNRRVQEQDRLPRIVVMFDEYANTRRGRYSEQAAIIDDICTEITQIGRASGIHLWIGIQQPRRDNMPSALRDNFTTMFIGHQANIGAGQSVTGNRSSLQLPDLPGRMLAYMGWKQFEVQMPLISDDDIHNAIQQAIEAYGDIVQYKLHEPDEESEQAPLTPHEQVIEVAMQQFDGALKASKIYDVLRDSFSRSEVTTIVKEIAALETVYHRGNAYQPEKQPGNYFVLVEPDNGQIASSFPENDTQKTGELPT